MSINGYTYPVGTDDNGDKFCWYDDPDVYDCEKCCFWNEKRCRYHELNKNKGGHCYGSGYFIRIKNQ